MWKKGVAVVIAPILAQLVTRLFIPEVPLGLSLIVLASVAIVFSPACTFLAAVISVFSIILIPVGDHTLLKSAILIFSSLIPMMLLQKRNQNLQKSLKLAVSVRESMMATLSHELKTPVTSIRLMADLMVKLGSEKEKAQKILDSCDQMKLLIDDILDVSKMEAGALKLKFESVSIKQVVDKALELTAPITNQKRIKIELNVEDVPLHCDGIRLIQVFVNLLNNAIKFSPSGGVVTVKVAKASHAHGFALIACVLDRGIGISKDDLTHMFDRYWQAAHGKTGSGLGLSIARSIVEAHDGKIWVHSKPGEGSEFCFSLPIAS